MIAKYHVEFSVGRSARPHLSHYQTDDPVACEEFLCHVLEAGGRIHAINHEGVPLPAKESDRLLKTAAGMLASRRLCDALQITPEEEHFRFGFAT